MGLRLALFMMGGAVLGFSYHRFVGCRTGACAITANPYISTLYGALMGYLLFGELDGLANGHRRLFLKKRLDQPSAGDP